MLPPPELHHRACLIVCEPRPRCAVWIRSQRPQLGPLVECRTWAASRAELLAAPESVVVFDPAVLGAAGAWGAVEALDGIIRRFPLARPVVVGPAVGDWEWLWREVGAAYWVRWPRGLARLAATIERHLAARRGTIVEQVWASLPWAAVP